MALAPENKKKIIRRVLFSVLLIFGAVLQNTPGVLPEPFGARQLGIVAAVVCIAMCERELYGMLLGLLAGAVLDISGGTQGINAIMLVLLGFVCGLLVTNLIRNNIFTALLLSAVALFVYTGVYWLVFTVIPGVQGAGTVYLTFYLPSIIYTLAVMPLWYGLVRLIFKSFPSEAVR